MDRHDLTLIKEEADRLQADGMDIDTAYMQAVGIIAKRLAEGLAAQAYPHGFEHHYWHPERLRIRELYEIEPAQMIRGTFVVKGKREGDISERSREILETEFPEYLRARMEEEGDDR